MMNEDLKLLNQSNIAIEFFSSNLSKITDTHNNKFVAIKGKEIIESGKSMGEVLENLESKGEDKSKILIKFVSKDTFIL